jgi:hypothetical protein
MDLQTRSPRRPAGDATLTALERRICRLEQVACSQSHELTVQFKRIAQLQAECDVLRIRFTKE